MKKLECDVCGRKLVQIGQFMVDTGFITGVITGMIVCLAMLW